MASCKSCGKEVTWATMRGSGAPMPVDPSNVPPENVGAKAVAVRRRDRLGVVLNEEAAAKVRGRPGDWSGWTFHTSHWETCPKAERHRVNPAQGALL